MGNSTYCIQTGLYVMQIRKFLVTAATSFRFSCILHVSTDYLLMGSEPSKEEVKNDLLSIISELSAIAKKI